MITAMHALVYSDDATATRAFFRDVLRWPFVSDDEGTEASDWLIFRSGRSEVGVHPTSGDGWSASRQHTISLLCDDLEATVVELRGRGAVIEGQPADRPFGLCVMVEVPGADPIMLYQPKHRLAYGL
ncbi:MAG TPA: VOC family protein [Lapillicoccus sp.]|jgi:predicted enzyme related to lactoylglutathione lyase|uniref:VOC family protein n=1 Tax=Lapillicoccus sp. TaxID=1909287 RepID=UPI002F95168C